MRDSVWGYASIAEVAEVPAEKVVRVKVCNEVGDDVTLVLLELTSRYHWDQEVSISLSPEGEEWWTLEGVENLEPVSAEPPVVLGDRHVTEVR